MRILIIKDHFILPDQGVPFVRDLDSCFVGGVDAPPPCLIP